MAGAAKYGMKSFRQLSESVTQQVRVIGGQIMNGAVVTWLVQAGEFIVSLGSARQPTTNPAQIPDPRYIVNAMGSLVTYREEPRVSSGDHPDITQEVLAQSIAVADRTAAQLRSAASQLRRAAAQLLQNGIGDMWGDPQIMADLCEDHGLDLFATMLRDTNVPGTMQHCPQEMARNFIFNTLSLAAPVQTQ